jgi:hypothetical protein
MIQFVAFFYKLSILNISVEAATRYGSGSRKIMLLLTVPAPKHWFLI